jgi:micrococcal nuclease
MRRTFCLHDTGRTNGFRRGVLALTAYLAVSSACMQGAYAAGCALEAGPARAMTQVIDGETLKLDDGSELRLAGIQAPRVPDGGGEAAFWPPAAEARQALEALLAGRSVEVAFAGPRSDRYGRTLAHLFVPRDGRRIWVQGELLAMGHARAFGLRASPCMQELASNEQIALAARRGLWAHAAYQVRAADDVADLMRYRHTLQVVEGEVSEVAEVKGRTYLNFGSEWRSDFTAAIEKGRSTGWPSDMKALKGERVRVRGFIERRNGPYIELTDPSQLELLPRTPEVTAASTTERPSRRSRRKAAPPE